MGYIKAEDVLPAELLRRVQDYAEGQLLYVPRRAKRRCTWGSVSGTRTHLLERNARIMEERRSGRTVSELARRYFLSEKSIQRILREAKPSQATTKEEGIP